MSEKIKIPISVRLTNLLISFGITLLSAAVIFYSIPLFLDEAGLEGFFSAVFLIEIILFSGIPMVIICNKLNKKYREKCQPVGGAYQ